MSRPYVHSNDGRIPVSVAKLIPYSPIPASVVSPVAGARSSIAPAVMQLVSPAVVQLVAPVSVVVQSSAAPVPVAVVPSLSAGALDGEWKQAHLVLQTEYEKLRTQLDRLEADRQRASRPIQPQQVAPSRSRNNPILPASRSRDNPVLQGSRSRDPDLSGSGSARSFDEERVYRERNALAEALDRERRQEEYRHRRMAREDRLDDLIEQALVGTTVRAGEQLVTALGSLFRPTHR